MKFNLIYFKNYKQFDLVPVEDMNKIKLENDILLSGTIEEIVKAFVDEMNRLLMVDKIKIEIKNEEKNL